MTPLSQACRKLPLDRLAARICGDLVCDRVGRILVATDGSIFERLPVAVVYPRSVTDVVETVRFAATHHLGVHPRGAGSGLCGSAIGDGLVIDFTRYMNRLLSLNAAEGWFECEPGYRLGQLEVDAAGTALFFPPDPSSGEYASFGGMVATNASGAHSVKYGNVADYLQDAQVVMADGSVVDLGALGRLCEKDLDGRFSALHGLYTRNREKIAGAYPPVRFNTCGYNLRDMVRDGRLDLRGLFAGAEGTLGVLTRLRFRLLPRPAHDSLVVALMDDIRLSARAVQQILPMGPSGIEIMDKSLLDLARSEDPALAGKIPEGVDNVLLIEFDGQDRDACTRQADAAVRLLQGQGLTDRVYPAVSPEEKARFWAVRKAAVPILYKLRGRRKILALIEDAAVPTDSLVTYFDGLYEILHRHGVRFVIYGHIAKGLLHTRPLLDLRDPVDVDLLRLLADDVFDLVRGLGGSISGEHGDGRLRSPYVRRQYPEIYPLFEQVKSILDPSGIFNPEIITVHDPDQMRRHLRFGADYRSRDLAPQELRWPEGFVEEVEKCHGCSKCTTLTTATRMCPVYKFTREEAATPRAKANVLRALISGVLPEEELFRAALQGVMNQCVNCGSCHSECPSGVNIPKMAMEARARYVKRFGPSLAARFMVSAELAGRYTRHVSKLFNPVMETAPMRAIAQRLAGFSAQRDRVVFAARSLFDRLPERMGAGDLNVLYFAGCYAGYMHPEIGMAAVRVLTAAGATVFLPRQHCCGLPMISKGMRDQAREKILSNLRLWETLAEQADRIVVTCSSCGLSLMQEWGYLLDPDRAHRIREKTVHISALILERMDRLRFNAQPLTVGYHAPCHLRVQPDADSSVRMMAALPGVGVEDLKSHCCGMAGSWGMTKENFDLSQAIGAPMIQRLDGCQATIGVTDCPTCRMQMEQFSRKPIFHPVEIVAERLAK
ncbi:MAG: anaerobic glycerol-3-phosphate dehydrogenase subunit C [Desulfobacterales bacterium]|nr:anaerobic glycerol-3-phosphate dehydrogenase subunit C [Desulfobacterales bacterium]